ncbi:MAG: hypothetical protein NT175_03480 [Bacteroidetes bacterium]|nr:hypothetical protein [Bacteroidota bacterium]
MQQGVHRSSYGRNERLVIMSWFGFLLFVMCFKKDLFLHEVTYNKKNTHNNEWESNSQDDAKAHTNRVVHIIIVLKDKRAQHKTYYNKDDTTNKFPFPCNDKEGE